MPADPSKTTKRRLAAVVSADAAAYSRLITGSTPDRRSA
jgi:hypothetical protein